MAHDRLRFCACLLVLGACTVGNDSEGFTSVMTSQTLPTTAPNDDSGGDETTETGGSTAGETSTGGGSGDDTGSTSVTTVDASSSSDSGVDPTGAQPADGMWSMCLAGADCGNTPILCIQSVDADMNPIDGFCSTTGCANPAVDCAPSPGGTAMPACAPITVNEMMEQACVLNCAGGLTCPMGMVCMNFTGLGMVCM
jgi:hypothetical protein